MGRPAPPRFETNTAQEPRTLRGPNSVTVHKKQKKGPIRTRKRWTRELVGGNSSKKEPD